VQEAVTPILLDQLVHLAVQRVALRADWNWQPI
jgi:hypothetical protein